MDSVKPIRHTEMCNFYSIYEKNDVARFCITLQCGKNKGKNSPFPETMKRIVVSFFVLSIYCKVTCNVYRVDIR